jgi:hypothetical protein
MNGSIRGEHWATGELRLRIELVVAIGDSNCDRRPMSATSARNTSIRWFRHHTIERSTEDFH